MSIYALKAEGSNNSRHSEIGLVHNEQKQRLRDMIMSSLALVVLPLFLFQGATAQLRPVKELEGLAYVLKDNVNDAIKAFNHGRNAFPLRLNTIEDSYLNGSMLYTWFAANGQVLTSGVDLIPQVSDLSLILSSLVGQSKDTIHLLRFSFPITLKDMVLKYDNFEFDFRASKNLPKLETNAAKNKVNKANRQTKKTRDNLGAISVEVVKNKFEVEFQVLHEYVDGPDSPLCLSSIRRINVAEFVLNPIQAHLNNSVMQPVIDSLANLIKTKLVEETNVIPIIEILIEQIYKLFLPFCKYVSPPDFEKALKA